MTEYRGIRSWLVPGLLAETVKDHLKSWLLRAIGVYPSRLYYRLLRKMRALRDRGIYFEINPFMVDRWVETVEAGDSQIKIDFAESKAYRDYVRSELRPIIDDLEDDLFSLLEKRGGPLRGGAPKKRKSYIRFVDKAEEKKNEAEKKEIEKELDLELSDKTIKHFIMGNYSAMVNRYLGEIAMALEDYGRKRGVDFGIDRAKLIELYRDSLRRSFEDYGSELVGEPVSFIKEVVEEYRKELEAKKKEKEGKVREQKRGESKLARIGRAYMAAERGFAKLFGY